jgi:hypothetical protein
MTRCFHGPGQQKSGEADVDGHDQRNDGYDGERHPASWT